MNTTAILVVAAIGFAISAGSGYFLIPYLHKLKFGQTILDIGPSWHKNKQGTPTMGGFMFILAVLIASVGTGPFSCFDIWSRPHRLHIIVTLRFS